MFTGIIRAVSQVRKFEKKNSSLFLMIEKPKEWRIKQGDSVAVNGVCLTVCKLQIANRRLQMVFELMAETLSKTTFGKIIPRAVNLEMPLCLGDRLDGHFVTGHIDTVGRVADIRGQELGHTRNFVISYPKRFSKLVVPKGSIAMDGVSLTVADVSQGSFSVSLVSYTLEHTVLGEKKVEDAVNLEFDVIAKYAQNL